MTTVLTDPLTLATPGRPELTRGELERYARHLLLPEVGVEGQRRLKAARVLLIGAGGLGSPAALYLAAAGVGTLGMVDFDRVDLSNLQRQVLYGTADVGRPKLAAARARLEDMNPHVHVVTHEERLTAANALELIGAYDLVVDGTDNFATRYLVNDACVLTGRPNVYGSIFRFDGQASVFCTPHGPCYRCLYPSPPPEGLVPSCAEGGVLGVLPGLIGTLQATEAIKLILGAGEPLIGRLWLLDTLRARIRTVRVRRDPSCPACGTRSLTALADYDAFCGVPGAGDSVPELTPREAAARLATDPLAILIDVREPHEHAMARLTAARLIPLARLAEAIPTLERGRPLLVHCKAGGRSATAVRQLRSAGFADVWNVAGGLLRWSDDLPNTITTWDG